ncbi:MAG: 50S ribosome-binding GTPase [Candidatus Nanoarchaeia archaeon]|nr:50S ribosome-binding GTPase [Candidatus Nanoarchaeia archaeon]
MNKIETIGKIEKYSFYLDTAFNRLSKQRFEIVGKDKLETKKIIATKKIDFLKKELTTPLRRIHNSFPSFTTMPAFYQNLLKLQFDLVDVRKNISSLNGSAILIEDFSRKYIEKVRFSRENNIVSKHLSEYFGKMKSVFKKLKTTMEELENLRKYIKSFPVIQDTQTISIAGLPNVGKTTIFGKLTNSFPEINSYPFTTKQIMVGYFKNKDKSVQLLDTPGALNRDFEKMNNVEKQAILALKFLSDKVLFLIDPTEFCGYTFEDQMKLFEKFKNKFSDKEFGLFFTKKDMFNEDIENKINNLDEKYNKFILKSENDIVDFITKDKYKKIYKKE